PRLRLSSRLRRPPLSPLFPYTTLFRSSIWGRIPGSSYEARPRGVRSPDPPGQAEVPLLVPGTARPGYGRQGVQVDGVTGIVRQRDRKSTRLNSSHVKISYAVFCLKKKN